MHSRNARVVLLVALVVSTLPFGGCSLSARRSAPQGEAPPVVRSVESTALGDPRELTANDVRRVFADFATFETTRVANAGTDQTDPFRDLVLRNIDFRNYISDEASSMPKHEVGRYETDAPELKGTAKSVVLSEALGYYDQIERSKGATAAYDSIVFAWSEVEHDRASRRDVLLDWLAPDMVLMSFMTAPPSIDGARGGPGWSWRVEDITIESADTARVTFSAMSSENWRGWSFKEEGRKYTKVWRFSYDAARQRWRVAAWPNRMEFLESVRSNVEDPSGGLSKKMAVYEVME